MDETQIELARYSGAQSMYVVRTRNTYVREKEIPSIRHLTGCVIFDVHNGVH